MISICIPTWNSLEYLKILVRSIKKNTRVPYKISIHNNGSTDGTHEWINTPEFYKDKNVSALISCNENLGFCGVNSVLRFAIYPYVMIANSDMYFLPGWDEPIVKQIKEFEKNQIKRFTISCCLIEPIGSNPEYTIFNAGQDAASFNEPVLLGNYMKMKDKWRKENTVQWSHPILVPTEMLREINYLDERYFPGWNVDNDLPRALYEKGCRNFVMLGDSRVYHFVSKTFEKLPDDVRRMDGQKLFLDKWGETTEHFRQRMNVRDKFQMVK